MILPLPALRPVLAVLLLGGLLAACVPDPETAERSSPDKSGYRHDPMCTRVYEPVCGRRGEREHSFQNQCEADAAGYSVIYDGTCE